MPPRDGSRAPRKRRAFSNRLTPAQAERLAILIEEAAEVQQVATKILRHGYHSVHPGGGPDNRELLMSEGGDLIASIRLLLCAKDIGRIGGVGRAEDKVDSWKRYTHRQPKALLEQVVAHAFRGEPL